MSGSFDRDAATRLSESALDAAWRQPSTLLLRIHEGQIPLRAGSEGGVEAGAELELQPVSGERTDEHFFLGRGEDRAIFATVASEGDGYGEPSGGWAHPFAAGRGLSALHRELMTVALALVSWHRTMPFSPRDGEPTTAAQGGWARFDERGGEHFPRTDPAVIVLIEHEDRLLLGSNVLWEAGRFSLLAGFVEAGESAEQAVVREVFEEAGVPVSEVQYVASQPWPFPRSLMLGFRARLAPGADPAALAPDVTEISELRWFTRDELRDPGPHLKLPGGLSIARWLIDRWIDEGDTAEAGVDEGSRER